MNILYLSIIITVISNIFYHIVQKNINSQVNPMVSLIVTYVIALIASLLIYPFFPSSTGFMKSLGQLNWATYLLGFTIIGVELGYLLAYRAGGNLSLTAIIVTLSVTLLLVPTGLIFFSEHLSMYKIIGIVFGIFSLILLNIK